MRYISLLRIEILQIGFLNYIWFLKTIQLFVDTNKTIWIKLTLNVDGIWKLIKSYIESGFDAPIPSQGKISVKYLKVLWNSIMSYF